LIDQRLERLLLMARQREPYHARAFSALTPVEKEVMAPTPTMAVNKRWQLLWSHAALDQWTEDEAVSVLCHEIRHLLRRHLMSRADAKDPFLWNICGDAEINDDLQGLPAGCVTPSVLGMPDHLLAEEYYEKILADAKPMPACSACRGKDGLGNEPDSDEPGLSEVEGELVREQVANEIKEWAKCNPGTVPRGDVVWADQTIESLKRPIPWERIISAKVRRLVSTQTRGRDDYSWRKLHRRTRPLFPLRPGTVKYKPKVGVVFDTSGSMDSFGSKALAVNRTLERIVGSDSILSWDCDVEAIKRRSRKAQHLGGGGTDMRVGIEAACKECDAVVIITDGESPFHASAPSGSQVIIALLKPEHSESMPKWADLVVVE